MELSLAEKDRLRSRYGTWAVVTGASSGIGRELARLLASAGISVVLVARNEEALQALADEVQRVYAVDARVLAIDVSERGMLDRLVSGTAHLDVGLVVLSAGYATSGQFIENALEEELDMLEVNAASVLRMTHYFASRFAARKRGGIVLMSSIVAFQGTPFAANYAATKAYVQTLAEGLSHELRLLGVDVLAAAPGPVSSNFESRAGMRMGKTMHPTDVAVPILRSLGKRHTVFPGGMTKLLMFGLRTVPRWGKIRIMKKVMRGMTRGNT